MANTPNYNLKKVEYTEIADIPGHFNANFDTIDTVMKNNADAATAAEDNAKSYASGLIGALSNLLTTAKNNIVAAVNEIFGKVEDVEDELTAHKAENVHQIGGVHGLEIEEGIWTPELYGYSTEGEFVYDSSKTLGRYKVIDDLVIAWFNIKISSITTPAAGYLFLKGLPFANKIDVGSVLNITYLSNIELPIDTITIHGTIPSGSNILRFEGHGNDIPFSTSRFLDSSKLKVDSEIRGTITYRK